MKITERLYKIFPATFPRFHITIERWKFNSQYKVWVSNQGNVLNEKKEPITAKTTDKKYMVFRLNRTLIAAHRLVLMTWCPRNDAAYLTVDHLNSNPRDNRLCNLEWVTEEENKRRARENFVNIPFTAEEKQIQKAKEKLIRDAAEKQLYNGFSKEQFRDMKLDVLTDRFINGTVWVEHTGFIVNKDNFIAFAAEKNGYPEGMEEKKLARKFICAGYSGKKYCGWAWRLKGEVEVEIKEKKSYD